MDFESSSKFISSLSKFIQSLCNGYVEFKNEVEVIGHIYLNVDTGKKIDYILNEKVCKTGENSVMFISNSFHAQPAEKPKPPAKTGQISDPIKPEDNDVNVGTVASRDSFQNVNTSSLAKPNRPSKRPFSSSFSSSHRHSAKQSRPDPSSGSNGGPLDTDSLHSKNSSSNFLPPQITGDGKITAATESERSHLSKVFPQMFNSSVNSLSATEDRDVKPQLDSDLKGIQMQQEYDPSGHVREEDSEIFDDSREKRKTFPFMSYNQFYGERSKMGQRSDYTHVGSMVQGEIFPSGVGPSLDATGGDSSDQLHTEDCYNYEEEEEDDEQQISETEEAQDQLHTEDCYNYEEEEEDDEQQISETEEAQEFDSQIALPARIPFTFNQSYRERSRRRGRGRGRSNDERPNVYVFVKLDVTGAHFHEQ